MAKIRNISQGEGRAGGTDSAALLSVKDADGKGAGEGAAGEEGGGTWRDAGGILGEMTEGIKVPEFDVRWPVIGGAWEGGNFEASCVCSSNSLPLLCCRGSFEDSEPDDIMTPVRAASKRLVQRYVPVYSLVFTSVSTPTAPSRSTHQATDPHFYPKSRFPSLIPSLIPFSHRCTSSKIATHAPRLSCR